MSEKLLTLEEWKEKRICPECGSKHVAPIKSKVIFPTSVKFRKELLETECLHCHRLDKELLDDTAKAIELKKERDEIKAILRG